MWEFISLYVFFCEDGFLLVISAACASDMSWYYTKCLVVCDYC